MYLVFMLVGGGVWRSRMCMPQSSWKRSQDSLQESVLSLQCVCSEAHSDHQLWWQALAEVILPALLLMLYEEWKD